MTQFYNCAEIEVLAPYEPSVAEIDNPALFANQVREEMARVLTVTTTEHSYNDAAFYREMMNANVKADFEVQGIAKMFSVEFDQLKEWLRLFQQLDTNGDGKIDRTE